MGRAAGRRPQEAEVHSSRMGLVGAGRLALPMVERLAAAGHDLVVYARRPETRAALEQLGVGQTGDLSEGAAGEDVLLFCVFNDEQVAEIAELLAGALPDGAVLASHVTGREATLRALAARFPGIEVVDAPVSRVAADIRAGHLTRLLGAPPRAPAPAAPPIPAYPHPPPE